MSNRIESIEFYLRETKPARFPSALGKAARGNQAPQHVTSPLCHVRLGIRDAQGQLTWGCAADRLSVRWLDKRPGRDIGYKRRELVDLLMHAKQVYLSRPEFETVFECWHRTHPQIMAAGRRAGQEDLTSTFVSALLERALIDAGCRQANLSLREMLQEDRLGFRPSAIHPSLADVGLEQYLPAAPTTTIHVRHTVGLFDPLTSGDWPEDQRLNDGLPETLEEYIRQQGIRYFKVKISGDAEADLKRLARLWEIMPYHQQPEITLDANEAFEDLEAFVEFVRRLEHENLGLFQHILYIEQPLPRSLALQPRASRWIREAAELKPIIIDESDGSLDSCQRALDLGYAGTSHKNCKGVFKSLTNLGLTFLREQALAGSDGGRFLLSAEDLQNLPVVPLQQDLVSVGILGLNHCERNGHHYNFGLSMLSPKDKERTTRRHPDLYEQRGDEWFMKIRDGAVQCASLHGPGFGIQDEPDWASMDDLGQWLDRVHPA